MVDRLSPAALAVNRVRHEASRKGEVFTVALAATFGSNVLAPPSRSGQPLLWAAGGGGEGGGRRRGEGAFLVPARPVSTRPYGK